MAFCNRPSPKRRGQEQELLLDIGHQIEQAPWRLRCLQLRQALWPSVQQAAIAYCEAHARKGRDWVDPCGLLKCICIAARNLEAAEATGAYEVLDTPLLESPANGSRT